MYSFRSSETMFMLSAYLLPVAAKIMDQQSAFVVVTPLVKKDDDQILNWRVLCVILVLVVV